MTRQTPTERAAADPTVLPVLLLALAVRTVDPQLADILVRCCWRTDTATEREERG